MWLPSSPRILRCGCALALPRRWPLYQVGFAGASAMPVPQYAGVAQLPLRGWNAGEFPWSALFVPPDGPDHRTLEILTEALTLLSAYDLQKNPGLPDLYQSGVRYELMPQTEYWLTPSMALAFRDSGRGVDCKTLSAWRAAELRVRGGEPTARCVWEPFKSANELVIHVTVRRADGSIEDPSAMLGMRTPAAPPNLHLIRGGLYGT